MSDESEAQYGPGGRGFYGAVTVSEREQVAIPAQARRDLGIEPGDKLLVLGDPERGLAFVTLELLMRNLEGSSLLLDQIQNYTRGSPGTGTSTTTSGRVSDVDRDQS